MSDNESTDPLVGTVVADRYKVHKRLGEGGMGEVYLAEHEIIQKKVALKVLRREYSEKADIVTRFQQEAISASRIKHPNVLEIFDFGQLDNGCFYLAMEFLAGHDLSDELQSTRVLPPARGIKIAMQICKALAAAHSQGVVHRDMKPENVFLQKTTDGEEIVKIVDFGIAQLRTNEEKAADEPRRRRLTKTGMIFGTPEYMSPEQAAGKQADQRVDVYAVGIILYEMFTGAVPFTGETFMAVLASHLNDDPPPMAAIAPDVAISSELQDVIMQALSKKPEARFQSMAELANAIAATPEGGLAGPMTALAPPELAGTQVSLSGGGAQTAAEFGQAPGTGGGAATGGASATNAQFSGGSGSSTAAQFTPGAGGGAGAGSTSQKPTEISAGGAAAAASGHVRVDSVADAPAPGVPPTVRADTHLDASAPIQPVTNEKKSPVGMIVGGVVAVAVVAGIGLYVVNANKTPDPEPAASVPVTPTESAPPVESVAVPATSASATPEPESDEITLKIVTKPAGALILKDGFEVCQKSPCEVKAKPDEKFELEAKLGAKRGKKKVLAQKDQTIEIKLAGAVAGPVTKKKKAPSGGALCMGKNADGLLVPVPCKN